MAGASYFATLAGRWPKSIPALKPPRRSPWERPRITSSGESALIEAKSPAADSDNLNANNLREVSAPAVKTTGDFFPTHLSQPDEHEQDVHVGLQGPTISPVTPVQRKEPSSILERKKPDYQSPPPTASGAPREVSSQPEIWVEPALHTKPEVAITSAVPAKTDRNTSLETTHQPARSTRPTAPKIPRSTDKLNPDFRREFTQQIAVSPLSYQARRAVTPILNAAPSGNSVHIGKIDIHIAPPPVLAHRQVARRTTAPAVTMSRGFASSFGLTQG